METVVFLLILGSVVAVVLYLLRHREPAPTPIRMVPAIVEQPMIAAAAPVPPPPIVVPKVAPPIVEPIPPPPQVEVVATPRPKRARKQPAMSDVPSQAAQSSVAVVLSMLKQRDSLAAAFVLREIFDAPVSRRRR